MAQPKRRCTGNARDSIGCRDRCGKPIPNPAIIQVLVGLHVTNSVRQRTPFTQAVDVASGRSPKLLWMTRVLPTPPEHLCFKRFGGLYNDIYDRPLRVLHTFQCGHYERIA